MNDANPSKAHGKPGPWFAAALIAAGIVGTIDWGRAIWLSTDPSIGAALTAWLVFVSLWVLGGIAWSAATAGMLWAATGRLSAVPFIQRAMSRSRRWWSRRHNRSDTRRSATFVAATIAIIAFCLASVAWTTHLIEHHTISWLIALISLLGQIAIGAILVMVALALRRTLRAGLFRLRKNDRISWLHFPAIVAATLAVVIAVLVAVAIVARQTFMAVEGPAFVLAAVAIIIHPAIAYLLESRLPLPRPIRRGLWFAPLLALGVAAIASQHSDARRIVVLQADAAHFAFHQFHRHIDVDQFFAPEDCPPIGPDGLPVDGTSIQEYNQRCIDPDYDRPFARPDAPPVDGPDVHKRPSFVFVTWDSVRVDRLGFMGHSRDTTPHLDAFAEEALVFDRAFAQDSGTGPSFWSLMAGKTPFQVSLEHGHRFPPPIAAEEPMLGELLDAAGYRNEAVMCGSVFDRQDWGIRRGFARFDNVCGDQLSELAPLVTDESIPTVKRLAESDEPFFLWIHYYDPHIPYNSHPDIGYGEGRLDRYDEELRYTDRHFGRLLETLEEVRADYDRPLFTMVGADHGENFDEHGTDPHARNLYRIVTQVPKLVAGPHIEPRRIDSPVALNDIYPTVLELADIDIPEESTMVSQMPVYFGADADRGRMVFQENSYSRPRRHTRAVVYDRYHYIMDLTTHTQELYDYVDDPLERRNLIGTGLSEEKILRQALIRFLQTSHIPEGLED